MEDPIKSEEVVEVVEETATLDFAEEEIPQAPVADPEEENEDETEEEDETTLESLAALVAELTAKVAEQETRIAELTEALSDSTEKNDKLSALVAGEDPLTEGTEEVSTVGLIEKFNAATGAEQTRIWKESRKEILQNARRN